MPGHRPPRSRPPSRRSRNKTYQPAEQIRCTDKGGDQSRGPQAGILKRLPQEDGQADADGEPDEPASQIVLRRPDRGRWIDQLWRHREALLDHQPHGFVGQLLAAMAKGEHDRNDANGDGYRTQPLHGFADRGPGTAVLEVSSSLIGRKLVGQFLVGLGLFGVGAADIDFEILGLEWRREHANQRQAQGQ